MNVIHVFYRLVQFSCYVFYGHVQHVVKSVESLTISKTLRIRSGETPTNVVSQFL
jgi:hypothetical protein